MGARAGKRMVQGGERAERFLLRAPALAPARNQAALDLIVAWHGAPIGHLTHDGFEWRWQPVEGGGPPLVRQTVPGTLPPFIVSLLPEGWLESVLKDVDERALLRSGKRYMSNITIVERESELSLLPPMFSWPGLTDIRRTAPSPAATRAGPRRSRRKLRAQSGAYL